MRARTSLLTAAVLLVSLAGLAPARAGGDPAPGARPSGRPLSAQIQRTVSRNFRRVVRENIRPALARASERSDSIARRLVAGADQRTGTADWAESQARVAALRAQLVEAGLEPHHVEHAIEHAILGLPSRAGRENPNDYLQVSPEFINSYNREARQPNWVIGKLTKADLGDTERAEKFKMDQTLPEGWGTSMPSDYKHSGYTRGHHMGSGERTSSKLANMWTFLLGRNISPQLYENNAGPTLDFERYYRDKVETGENEVYLINGPVFGQRPKKIGRNRVWVPEATWKIAVFVKPGETLADIDENTRVVSILVPNEPGKVSLVDTFEQYRVKPSEIEARTGFRFFTNLPEAKRQVLVDKLDTETVPVRYWPGWKIAEAKRAGLTLPPNVQREPENGGKQNPGAPEPSDWQKKRWKIRPPFFDRLNRRPAVIQPAAH